MIGCDRRKDEYGAEDIVGSEGGVAGGNSALRALLEEAGMSHAGLARAVVTAGAEEGAHVGTNTTSVRRMLDGCQPRWPVPRLVATVLSRKLHQEINITDCGFADRAPASEEEYDGLRCSGTLEGTLRTVVELSGRDMRRRKLLLGSAFSAAAFSEPALFALTVPPAESTARVGGLRVGMADVEILTEQIAHLHRLGYRYGAGRVREQAVQLLHHEASTVLHGNYTEKTGKALLGAVAQASLLAAAMADDVGRHSLAQRYDIQALDLAMAAGDRRYAGYVLACMSRFTVQIGSGMVSEHDRLRNARQCVALARAGRDVAGGMVTPGLAALLYAVEARGHALLGDVKATRHAVLEAERHYERSHPGDEPSWMDFFTPAELAADLGRCLRDTGEPNQGVKLSQQALDSYEPWRIRSCCFVQTDLATAHLVGRDFEQTAALGQDALRTAAQVSSTRTLDRLSTLQRQIQPLRAGSPHLRDLDEQITGFLTRSAQRDGDLTV